jgi:outer membrane protein OmpA-like peptidoglycan-associated protein
MISIREQVVVATVAALSLGIWGCATKKHVREAIAPVQQQVNQVQKDTASNKTAIGDLDRQVASADEKAQDAGRKAQEAANAAAQANSAAQQAATSADSANSQAQQAINSANQVGQTLQTSLQNLDNYTETKNVQVFFRIDQSTLSKEAKEQLDEAVQNAGGMHNYIVEVEGFTDRTGGKAYNLDLARRRADAVVHYLTVEKDIPLRDVRQLGVGSEFPNADNKTRAARKENRRVDVKIYSLNLTAQPGNTSMNETTPTELNPATGSSDRMKDPTHQVRPTTMPNSPNKPPQP